MYGQERFFFIKMPPSGDSALSKTERSVLLCRIRILYPILGIFSTTIGTRRFLEHEQSDHRHRRRLRQRQDHTGLSAQGTFRGGRGALISHDSYYKRHRRVAFEERRKLNYDHPDAFDNALLIYHLQELKAGRAIDCPVYDYADHNRKERGAKTSNRPLSSSWKASFPSWSRSCAPCSTTRSSWTPTLTSASCAVCCGRQGARPLPRQRYQPVPHHRQAHARGFR